MKNLRIVFLLALMLAPAVALAQTRPNIVRFSDAVPQAERKASRSLVSANDKWKIETKTC